MSVYFLTEWLKSRFLVKVLCYKPSRLFLAESDRRGLNENGARGGSREHLNESSQGRNWSFEALLLRGKRKKEGARRSVFTNMRCSREID